LGRALRHALSADRDRRALIFALGPLLEDVAVHGERSTVRNIDEVTRGSIFAVRNLVANEFGSKRTRLDVMPCVGLKKSGALNPEQRDMPHIDAVRATPCALAVSNELAVNDPDAALRIVSYEHAILVVDEATVLDR